MKLFRETLSIPSAEESCSINTESEDDTSSETSDDSTEVGLEELQK